MERENQEMPAQAEIPFALLSGMRVRYDKEIVTARGDEHIGSLNQRQARQKSCPR